MNDRQENRYSMMNGVEGLLNENKSLWESNTVLTTSVSNFSSHLQEVRDLEAIQINSIKLGDLKQKEEDEMINDAVLLASTLFAYASIIGNDELKGQAKHSPSSLKRNRDTILLEKCRQIHVLVSQYLDDLAPYGVTQAMLDNFEKETDDYESIISRPSQNAKTRGMASRLIDDKLDAANQLLLDQIDNLMEMYKLSSEVFYNQYKAVRVIADL